MRREVAVRAPSGSPETAQGREDRASAGCGLRGGPRLCLRRQATTYLESFISICCRISCLSSSVLLGKMFTARSSFLHFLGSVPESRRRDGREGTRTRVLVGRWLADPAAPLLLEGICTGAAGMCLPACGAFGRAGGRYRERVMSPPVGHAFHGWAIDHGGPPGAVLPDTCSPRVTTNGTQASF